jgi:hypothetical protein
MAQNGAFKQLAVGSCFYTAQFVQVISALLVFHDNGKVRFSQINIFFSNRN